MCHSGSLSSLGTAWPRIMSAMQHPEMPTHHSRMRLSHDTPPPAGICCSQQEPGSSQRHCRIRQVCPGGPSCLNIALPQLRWDAELLLCCLPLLW